MTDKTLPRQRLPVVVTIEGGDFEDREYWASRLIAWLENQPCQTQRQPTFNDKRKFKIYPQANND